MEEETSGDYSGAISKMAIGKMCAALGFKQIQQGALESLADIAKEYIGTLGRNIVNISETGGRAIPGVHDAITALEDTKPKKTNAKDLKAFGIRDPSKPNQSVWSQPLPFQLSNFPADSTESKSNSYGNDPTMVKDLFIPSHLPPYPPAHTYRRSQISKKRANTDGDQEKISRKKMLTSAKKAQSSLIGLENSVDIDQSEESKRKK